MNPKLNNSVHVLIHNRLLFVRDDQRKKLASSLGTIAGSKFSCSWTSIYTSDQSWGWLLWFYFVLHRIHQTEREYSGWLELAQRVAMRTWGIWLMNWSRAGMRFVMIFVILIWGGSEDEFKSLYHDFGQSLQINWWLSYDVVRVKCVVKVKSRSVTSARDLWIRTRIKYHLWIHLYHIRQCWRRSFLLTSRFYSKMPVTQARGLLSKVLSSFTLLDRLSRFAWCTS